MIRVGFIGTGNISATHLRYLAGRPDVAIEALCDIDEQRLAGRSREFGGKPFSDFREMLDAVPLDAVWICTPQRVRREPLLACADRGLAVFCEKPVEHNAERAAEISAELSRRNARVQVGYLFRSLPVVRRLREEMAGDVIRLIASYYGCSVGIDPKLPNWFCEKEKSGGPLVDQATHNLDLLRNLFGEVVRVQGTANNPRHPKVPGYTIDEVISVGLRFANGMVGSHNHTWLGDGWRNEILLSGERRFYRLDLTRGRLTVEEAQETRTFQQDATPIHHYQDEVFLRGLVSGTGTDNPCSYADGLSTLRLTLACNEAVERVDGAAVAVTP